MDTIKGVVRRVGLITAIGVSLAAPLNTFAIEGLRLSLQCSNVVLFWPSTPGQNYIIQYRPTLDPSTPWQTLTNSYPADWTTNITVFVHSNIVQNPSCGGTGGGSLIATSPMMTQADSADATTYSVPMVKHADGSGPVVPLAIYPPGIDLSRFIIFDPSTGDWMSGAGLTRQINMFATKTDGPPTPLDGGSGDGGTNSVPAPETGFYQVVQQGVHFWGLTNGTVLSGLVNIPLELGLSSTGQITGLSFSSTDGSPLIGANDKNSGAPWVMEWDTTMVPNGTYAISAGVDFAGDASMTNVPVTVTVSNVVLFPNYFTRNFGNWMWVYAESTVYPAYVDIDMYAGETNYIGTFTDYTYDGVVSFIWDLTDGGNYTFTNATFRGEFFFTPDPGFAPQEVAPEGVPANGASPSSPGNGTNFWAKESGWSGIGKFVVAYSPADGNTTKTMKIGLMVSGGAGGEYGGVTQTLGNYGLGRYELSPGNPQGSAFLMNTAQTKAALLSYLGDLSYRNFYYFGHGSPSAVGGAPGTTTPSITASDFQNWLCNFPSSAKPANYHPYRLVFLDGCDTGAGKMCEKFGIPAQTVSTNFFNFAGLRSRAFLGFKKSIAYDDAQWTWRSMMLCGFFADWQEQKTLDTCVSNAVVGAHSSGFQKMDSSWVIYGAYNLRIDSR